MTTALWPQWKEKTSGMIMPDERLPTQQSVIAGFQHVVAMFGSTALAPLLMGFPPNVAIFFSGIATLIFFLVVQGRLPSYLGSSFAFISVVAAASGYQVGSGAPNANISVALGGIIACGFLYFLVGLVVQLAGHRWIEKLMPPVVTGAIVAVIGLNLSTTAVSGVTGDGFKTFIGLFTVAAVGLTAVYAPGFVRRLPVLVGAIATYILYYIMANLMGYGAPIDFSGVVNAAWVGLPEFHSPTFSAKAVTLITPVVFVLIAENLGHIKAISAMTGQNYDSLIGRAFMADGFSTMVSGSAGGTGVTTYAENMGVMAVTRNFSTFVFVIAGFVAIALGLSPKFGALILTIPGPVIGGLSIVMFGLIAAAAGRIWVENGVDFASPRNLITVGVALVLGAGDLTLTIGSFALGGIGTATFGTIILYHMLCGSKDEVEEFKAPKQD
ncbi:MAG: NCS2 family nucleobase:cation symporter [Methylobacteriaceae bacterium]|nr:NCS2 family nucleobase:cation symporter [Methylobacteriaceae bacterium]